MGIKISNALTLFLAIFFGLNTVCPVNGGETCTSFEGGRYVQEYCDYGCCGSGNSEYCCSISTSVLVVACIVSGLVLIALITAIIICCYKNYKDKQTTRVRRLRQQENMNAPRVPGVEPPKPPSYVSAPPAYSEQMPESHFRPASVTGNIPYNQRFRGTTPGPRGPRQSNISFTNASGRHPNNHSFRTAQIPGAVEVEAPPPYTEYARGQTPANRRRRFIRTPVPETTAEVNEQNIENNHREDDTDIFSEVTQVSETSTRAQQSRTQTTNTRIQPSRAETTRAVNSRETESRAVTTRVQESRAENLRETESRAETVARVLRPTRISRIPTRVQGAQSRQLSDVTSRASSIISTPVISSSVTRNPNAVTGNIEDLAVI